MEYLLAYQRTFPRGVGIDHRSNGALQTSPATQNSDRRSTPCKNMNSITWTIGRNGYNQKNKDQPNGAGATQFLLRTQADYRKDLITIKVPSGRVIGFPWIGANSLAQHDFHPFVIHSFVPSRPVQCTWIDNVSGRARQYLIGRIAGC